MITETIESLDLEHLFKSIDDLLYYEKIIEFKKMNNIKLTKDEYFFDLYFVKPSFLISCITGVKDE